MAIEFAKLGSTVVGCDISTDGLNATKELLERHAGAGFHAYTCDLSSRDAIYKLADKVSNYFRHFDFNVTKRN